MNHHLTAIAQAVALCVHAVLLVDHCFDAWNKLTDQSWRIMFIGLRQWVHG